MLIVVKDRDLHALLERLFDNETLGGLDIFQIDTAKAGFQAGHRLDELLRVPLLDLDIEHIDIRKLLEEYRLALHHRLGGETADGAEAQYRGAVGDHGHQIAARGVVRRCCRVLRNLLAGRRHTRRIGQGQIPLVGHRFGGLDLQLSRLGVEVVVECRLSQLFRHNDWYLVLICQLFVLFTEARAGGRYVCYQVRSLWNRRSSMLQCSNNVK